MAAMRFVGRVGALLAAAPIAAAAEPKKEPCKKCCKSKLVKPSELPIYDKGDCGLEYEVVDRASKVEYYVQNARLSSMAAVMAVKDAEVAVVHFYETGKAHSKTTLEYLTDEANIIPRAGAITLGGLTGLLIGARGGFFKKLIYTGVGMVSVASVCYPKQAVQVSQDLYTIGRYYAYLGYASILVMLGNSKPENSSNKTATKPTEKQQSTVKAAEQLPNKTVKPLSGDPGQSNPADKDMYTTRQ